MKGEELGGHGGGGSEGWKKVPTRGERACELPVKVLGVSWRWRSHGDAEQQEGITVRFGSKQNCGKLMRLVQMDRGFQVGEGREGDEDHT